MSSEHRAAEAKKATTRERARLRLLSRGVGFLAVVLDIVDAAEQLKPGTPKIARARRRVERALKELRAAAGITKGQ